MLVYQRVTTVITGVTIHLRLEYSELKIVVPPPREASGYWMPLLPHSAVRGQFHVLGRPQKGHLNGKIIEVNGSVFQHFL